MQRNVVVRAPARYTGPVIIQDNKTLRSFCRDLDDAPYVAVDTEFLREKTYYSKLCLIQVAYGDFAAAIDPLADGIDLDPLLDVLYDESLVKVFHSATQDLELFYTMEGDVPWPVYDTQIAAMVCGLGEQPGYATLVQAVLGREIDKGPQFTDWSARPLSKRQLDYALGDVTHLCEVYEHLTARLREEHREDWVAEEMDALRNLEQYFTKSEEAYLRLKLRKPTPRALGVLREVAAWREETAKTRNLPRTWVIKDDTVSAIATQPPRSVRDLARVRGLPPTVANGKDGAAILAAVERAFELPDRDLPPAPPRTPRPEEGNDRLVALLQALLKVRCEEHQVASKLIATRADLDAIALQANPDVRALHGWRRELFGADALALKEGRIALTGDGPGVQVIEIAEGARSQEPPARGRSRGAERSGRASSPRRAGEGRRRR